MIGVYDYDIVVRSGGAETPGNIFFGGFPPREELFVLSGDSNHITAVEIIEGSSFDQGSLILGGASPSGVLQVYDIASKQVVSVTQIPTLNSDHIYDVKE